MAEDDRRRGRTPLVILVALLWLVGSLTLTYVLRRAGLLHVPVFFPVMLIPLVVALVLLRRADR